jgi:hypothetical protein
VVPRQVRPLGWICRFFKERMLMNNLILGCITFAVVFLFRLLFYFIGNKKSKNKGGIWKEMQYLIVKFKLDEKKVNKKSIAAIISILDAFIISLTLCLVIIITDNVPLELILGLVFVIVLIYLVYEIFGRILVRKGYGRK